ncbi:DUF2167 domain-containing protein [Dichelobacter nodosus]|uniref:Uncharacterized protein n=1 Tax=Dichelobacter nodosus (strain VCS1703A) TaxID=246195 RepID=A5EW73_DICNV|nr:DUF2167 domain-containing protein [Dichelobacter nodosus]ABQ13858.1 hypothetical protein DNO_0308 [Dichelobacter nodosus VCS1703A]AXM45213.1 DUF2167 domain-containing protein [Dichelobacter nodosus]KNZ39550.1 hypothetical protein AKG33_03070 [Dichelobacter nodosus]TGA64393.1 DUF2167 domain-containing protein [Dichelobacter nodosus]
MTMATLRMPESWVLLKNEQRARFLREIEIEDEPALLAVAQSKEHDHAFALLRHQKSGYVVRPEETPIHPQLIRKQTEADLAILNSESALSEAERVRWQKFYLEPVYQAQTRTVEYGITLLFGNEAAVNLYRMLLVRDGALVLTLVGKPSDHLSLADWAIEPKDEMRYERFDPAHDKKSEGTLDNLILMNRFI